MGRSAAPAGPTVNNVAAAQNCAARFAWCRSSVFTTRVFRFSASVRPPRLTTSRPNEFQLIRQPATRGWILNNYSRGPADLSTTLLYSPAGSRLREAQRHKPTHNERKGT